MWVKRSDMCIGTIELRGGKGLSRGRGGGWSISSSFSYSSSLRLPWFSADLTEAS